ncbi:hypothetical protein [Curtobacterium sp. 9128]|uniref:hypothetical protein n=1 Tax=Curtobacterium sp. 9128 TaxID=1793722 RepID=UPI00164314CE|nr:hypothetical protein [Curtobacterium sp. 9128]
MLGTDQGLDGVGELLDLASPIELEVSSVAEERFDFGHVPSDRLAFARRVPVGVVRPMTNTMEQHVEWCAEEDDVIEAVVEVGLVLGSPSNHDMVVGPQEVSHLVGVPRAAAAGGPAPVVRVDRAVAAASDSSSKVDLPAPDMPAIRSLLTGTR